MTKYCLSTPGKDPERSGRVESGDPAIQVPSKAHLQLERFKKGGPMAAAT